MIFLTRLDGQSVVVNDDLIVFAEKTPDTVLTLSNGARLMVRESLEVVVTLAAEYRRRIGATPWPDRPRPEAVPENALEQEDEDG
jgi:flagellar protein FlbD